MLAFEQNIPLNSNLLEQDPLFGFGFDRAPCSTNNVTTEQETTVTDDPEQSRRLRRMKSNRESARRSRMRKRIRTEELRAELAQLQAQNRDLRAELGSVLNRTGLVRHENGRLAIQAAMYNKRLVEMQMLMAVIRRLRLRHVNVTDQSFHASVLANSLIA